MSNPTSTMRAYVGTPAEPALRTVRDSRPMPGEALVRVEAFSVNSDRELGLFACRSQGWRPGRHIAGHVLAVDGGG
jgi:NADPH:quinone reductase-like Zn-dependent oxidoreductase